MEQYVYLSGDRSLVSIRFDKDKLNGTIMYYDKFKLNAPEMQIKRFANEDVLKEVTSEIIYLLIKNDNAKIITFQQFDTILHSYIIAHGGFKL